MRGVGRGGFCLGLIIGWGCGGILVYISCFEGCWKGLVRWGFIGFYLDFYKLGYIFFLFENVYFFYYFK